MGYLSYCHWLRWLSVKFYTVPDDWGTIYYRLSNSLCEYGLCANVYVYIHIFFISSYINRCIGCFHILSIAYSAVMMMSIQELFDKPTSFSLDKHLVVGLLYHMLALFRVLRHLYTIFHSGYTSFIPSNCAQRSLCLHILVGIWGVEV